MEAAEATKEALTVADPTADWVVRRTRMQLRVAMVEAEAEAVAQLLSMAVEEMEAAEAWAVEEVVVALAEYFHSGSAVQAASEAETAALEPQFLELRFPAPGAGAVGWEVAFLSIAGPFCWGECF